ncbi:uncharacterized protein [Fopius arisanus]|uniref:Gustatory receptor n=1 Tax=Fopius arisanus TaxID=64838 RepID=A0A9R1U436_9HYME|nr:PREDICTED: uncharacterized protein LOC105269621 [Fopius arisanus]
MPELNRKFNNQGLRTHLAKFALYFFKVIGLLPLGVKLTSGRLEIHTSRIGYAYSLFLVVVIFGLDFYSIPYTYQMQYIGDSVLTRRLKLTKAVIGTIVLFLVWFIMCLRQRVLTDIISKWINVDREMTSYNQIHQMRASSPLLMVFFISNLMIWAGVITTDVLILEAFGANVLFWVSMIIPSFIVSWLLIQYTMVLCLLTLRFQSVNRTIVKLNGVSEGISLDHYITPVLRVPLDRSIVGTLLAVKKIHAHYYEVSNDIANFYAVPLLFAVTFYCGTIIYSAYYLIIPLISISWGDRIVLNTANAVLMLIMQLFPIVMMAICVNRLTHEMNMTADAVHKLLAWSLPSREVKSEVNQFEI